ncbi:ceramide glucosyltransferase [Arthroderma uncinatum]|uniref:ceramide glucosyltransferase n=1 Tax=Arthroderma uncinatum TaxID=74035 RepID=UPI00144A5AB0|nr:ceramide glucosyltransferase [Arthroderma uncinatum]KAF3479756.1 ceramide glucosyltransferase [Arthroderma uncinatum]
MVAESALVNSVTTCSQHGQSLWLVAAGWLSIGWYLFVVTVSTIGAIQIFRKYSKPLPKATRALTDPNLPHVTIIRPIKGLEPYLYENLASSFLQDYPRDKLSISLCVSSKDDPAYPVIEKVLARFPEIDARLYLEPKYEDHELGPNPKIRNMSQAYRELKGDVVWVIDCNVWLGKGVCSRMVERLCGLDSKGQKYKFVHHLPIVVDVDSEVAARDFERNAIFPPTKSMNGNGNGNGNGMLKSSPNGHAPAAPTPTSPVQSILSIGGGRLEEIFLSSSHAKMYCAINTVLVAPCVVGKSTMFRRSHLDQVTLNHCIPSRPYPRRPGLDSLSDNICEDHLLGERMWNGKLAEETEGQSEWGKHDLVFGDLAIQPVAKMPVSSYIDRRVRWIRVRKYIVIMATIVEPGIECFLCSAYLAFGITTALPPLLFGSQYCSNFLSTWHAFGLVWGLSTFVWMLMDFMLYRTLLSSITIEVDENTPQFARPPPPGSIARRSFPEWFLAWLGRETLALPIWIWSVFGGATIIWRDREFRVGMDNVAHAVGPVSKKRPSNGVLSSNMNGHSQRSYGSDDSCEVRRRTPIENLTKIGMKTTAAAIDLDETSRLL